MDETYVRGGGRWLYLFRAVDKRGRLIASMLSGRRDTGAALRRGPCIQRNRQATGEVRLIHQLFGPAA